MFKICSLAEKSFKLFDSFRFRGFVRYFYDKKLEQDYTSEQIVNVTGTSEEKIKELRKRLVLVK